MPVPGTPTKTPPPTSRNVTTGALASASTAVGAVTDNGDGTFRYDPDDQFENLGVGEIATDSFSYTIADSNGATDTATVTITIEGVNDAPVAVDDDFTTDEE